ncbi:MAG: 50S ribosomal protein L23 [Prevotella sp.]|nr:50S ribosomal protein L23 [Prevotella sp.]
MAFIIKPLVTEKMTKTTEKRPNVYGFIVTPDANKVEIKKEVEKTFNVTVEAVNTVRYTGKRSRRYTKAGLVTGQKSAYKKAIVTLKEGEEIDIYSNIEI